VPVRTVCPLVYVSVFYLSSSFVCIGESITLAEVKSALEDCDSVQKKRLANRRKKEPDASWDTDSDVSWNIHFTTHNGTG